MEMASGTEHPREYDEERLRLFYVRATHGGNMPKAYKPDYDEVDLAAFADAIIGSYVERAESDEGPRREMELGRVAFAISFLEGEPLELLNEQIKDDVLAKRKGVREFALGVAGEGARHLQDTIFRDEAEMSETKVSVSETHNPVDEFMDLEDVIKRFYAEGRIPGGKAQALLLLFGLQRSSASLEAQHAAIERVCLELRPRLKTAIITQPHIGEKMADRTFDRGSRYVKEVIKSPGTAVNGGRILKLLAELETRNDFDPADCTKVHAEILGHVGYVLDKLYPTR